MKKRNPFVTTLLFVLLLSTACNFHNHHTKTVKIDDGNTAIKIEYCGDIAFADDGGAIEAISPDGYIKYRDDDTRFVAESDDEGNITYRLYNGHRWLHPNDDEARAFMAEKLKLIEEHYYK
jgi:hypothetical protein